MQDGVCLVCQRLRSGKALIDKSYTDRTRRREPFSTAPGFDQCRAARSAI